MITQAEAEDRLRGVTVPFKVVAQLFGVSLPTVYAAALRGELKTVQIGGRKTALAAPLRKQFGFPEPIPSVTPVTPEVRAA